MIPFQKVICCKITYVTGCAGPYTPSKQFANAMSQARVKLGERKLVWINKIVKGFWNLYCVVIEVSWETVTKPRANVLPYYKIGINTNSIRTVKYINIVNLYIYTSKNIGETYTLSCIAIRNTTSVEESAARLLDWSWYKTSSQWHE